MAWCSVKKKHREKFIFTFRCHMLKEEEGWAYFKEACPSHIVESVRNILPKYLCVVTDIPAL
jgi:hypothetical protein